MTDSRVPKEISTATLREQAERARLGNHFPLVEGQTILHLVEVVEAASHFLDLYSDSIENSVNAAEIDDASDRLSVTLARFEPRVSWAEVLKEAGIHD